MSSPPVDPATIPATSEFVEIPKRERLAGELIEDVLLWHGLQNAIAPETPAPWSERQRAPIEIESAQDLPGLDLRIRRSWTVAVAHNRVHQKPSIPRQQRPILSGHDRKQPPVVGIPFVSRIDTQQSQIARKLSEMPVRDEPIS